MNDQIVLNRHDAVAEVVINRPEKMNAITPAMSEALAAMFTALDKDDGVRIVLLRGEGERAFCAGSDLRTLESYETIEAFRHRCDYGTTVRQLRKPLVVALKGWVLGGGLEIMLGADIRVAGHSARFGAPEVVRGWVGGGGASQMLPRLVGYGQAMRLLLSGEPIDAQEAFRCGLVEYLVEDDKVIDAAMTLCRKIVSYDPLAVQAVKSAVRAALSTPVEVGAKYENELTTLCFSAGNYKKGADGFNTRHRHEGE